MAKDLPDLRQRRPSPEHRRRGGMPQTMRMDPTEPSTLTSGEDDLGDTTGAQPLVRSLDANENRPVQSAVWPAVTQIAADRLPDIDGQREPLAAAALADHNQLPSTPVNIVE